jgi:hypothetical protein
MDPVLKKYMEDSYINYVLYSEAASSCKYKDNILSIINVVLVGATGIATNVNTENNTTYQIFISCIIYASLVLSGIQKYFGYSDLYQKHSSSSNGYLRIYKSIRDKNTEFKENIIKQFNIVEALQADIPSFLKNKKITVPEELNVVEIESFTDNDIDNQQKYELDNLKKYTNY